MKKQTKTQVIVKEVEHTPSVESLLEKADLPKIEEASIAKVAVAPKKVPAKKYVFKPLPFNYENVTAFANSIYQDAGGVISFTKLCNGQLTTKKGAQIMHCGLGEAYAVFIDPIKKPADEDAVCRALVRASKFASEARGAVHNWGKKAQNLMDALGDVPEENDNEMEGRGCSADPREYMDRSRRVADVFRHVAKLLK